VNDAVFWLLLVAAILAVQATEATPASQPPDTPATSGAPTRTTALGAGGAAGVARVALTAGALLMCLIGLLTLAGAEGNGSGGANRNHDLVGGALQLAAGLVSLALFYGGTRRILGLRRLREGAPVSWLAILLFCESLAVNLAPASGQDTVSSTVQSSSGSGTSAESLMIGAVPFLVIGIAAVGPGVRRTVRQSAERLGLWPLRLPWWVVGLAIGLVLVPVGDWVAGLLTNLTSAHCLAQQVRVEQAITGTGRTALEQIGVAVAAGICEETLFRGALQPRFGIVLSSALWASYHLQYTCNGLPSTSNLYILLLGFVLGGLRKAGGLWPAIVAHTVYDGTILLGLL
jgi:uncharacterized protein